MGRRRLFGAARELERGRATWAELWHPVHDGPRFVYLTPASHDWRPREGEVVLIVEGAISRPRLAVITKIERERFRVRTRHAVFWQGRPRVLGVVIEDRPPEPKKVE
jgi:hypothetical protein